MDNADDHFSLKWNNFRSSLTEGFHDLLQEEMMVDVTLAAEGKFLQAHKLVLSVCSPYFKNLFKVNPCKHPIVILKDVTHHELSYMLQFMYKGEVGVKHEELPSFLKLADTLKLKGLAGIKVENEVDHGSSQVYSDTRGKKRKSFRLQSNSVELESNICRLKEMRSTRHKKRRLSSPLKSDQSRCGYSKKVTPGKSGQERDYCSGDEHLADDSENDALVKFIVDEVKDKCTETSGVRSSTDNAFDNEDLEGKTSPDVCDLSTSLFDSSTEAEQAPQGGVDYQMIQTKRGKDMLLYDGYTFTQNRMCKDGMRWQCSFPKCKAFCRMSSAGWLTPHKTNHEHPKPSEEEIKKRILRMELKARAQSSGATPGEIIRNALPAEEYQTTDQRACYTRCIQRFRKSLQRKNTKPPEGVWVSESEANSSRKAESDGCSPEEGTCVLSKAHGSLPMVVKEGLKEEPLWTSRTSESSHMSQSEDGQPLMKQKNDLHAKIGPYGM